MDKCVFATDADPISALVVVAVLSYVGHVDSIFGGHQGTCARMAVAVLFSSPMARTTRGRPKAGGRNTAKLFSDEVKNKEST